MRTILLRSAVGLLALIGVAAAIGRGVDVTRTLTTPGRQASDLSPLDRQSFDQMAALAKVVPGSTAYADVEAEAVLMNGKFISHPIVTLLHILPGVLFMVLGPLQFSSRLRTRYVRVHRWTGRLLLASAIPVGLSAFFFGLLMPFSGAGEAVVIAIVGVAFLFAIARGYLAIRRGQVDAHREWMIRMFALALGVSTVRLVSLVLLAVTRATPVNLFVPSLWVGWLLTSAVAELWIRHTRPPRSVPRALPLEVLGHG